MKTIKLKEFKSPVGKVVDAHLYFSDSYNESGEFVLIHHGKDAEGTPTYFIEVFEYRGGTHIATDSLREAIKLGREIAKKRFGNKIKDAKIKDVIRRLINEI